MKFSEVFISLQYQFKINNTHNVSKICVTKYTLQTKRNYKPSKDIQLFVFTHTHTKNLSKSIILIE